MSMLSTKNPILLRRNYNLNQSRLWLSVLQRSSKTNKIAQCHHPKAYVTKTNKPSGFHFVNQLQHRVVTKLFKNQRYYFVVMGAAVTGISAEYKTIQHQSSCEEAIHLLQKRDATTTLLPTREDKKTSKLLQKWKQKVKKALRLLKRSIQLLLVLAPLAGLYPLRKLLPHSSDDKADIDASLNESKICSILVEKYFLMCLGCIEWAGATIIKLTQWASSRPDLFGEDFCQVFSRLQDDTTPHKLEHTIKILENAYGKDWAKHIQLGKIIGSGCIGQVYKGSVEEKNGKKSQVAIKVMHPDVRSNIYADLELLQIFVHSLENLPFGLGKSWKYYDLPGIVKKFEDLLMVQLDFRNEANHLEKFNRNFANDINVIFPEVMKDFEPRQDILIESFCEGTPILQFAKEHESEKEILTKLCHLGIKTICKMIFEHNFIHGDLHPGNILVSPSHKLILLDAGMITEYDDKEHNKLISILTSFIRKNGRRAGELLIADSNSRMKDFNEVVIQEEAYIEKIEALTDAANDSDYLMEKLGTYISYICDAAAVHHVMMNPTFVSAALAVKIQEGIVLSLDRDVSIWPIANPIILKTELYHEIKKVKNLVIQKFESLH